MLQHTLKRDDGHRIALWFSRGTNSRGKSRRIASGCHAPGAPEAISKGGPGTHRAGAALLVDVSQRPVPLFGSP